MNGSEKQLTTTPPAVGVLDDLTDMGNARRLVERHGDDLRYCGPWGRWLVWDGRRWLPDDTGEVDRRAKDTARSIAAAAAVEADCDRMRRLSRHASRSMSAGQIRAMIQLAASEPRVPILPDRLDADPMLLNVVNGTIDLRTGALRPHARADLLTKLCPTPYDPDATCPTWESFLATVFPATGDAAEEPGDAESIAFLQRLLGYCLTGDVREQVLCVFHGDGANGKSTLLNTVLGVLGGDYAGQATPDLLLAGHKDRHPTERADLFGRRLVVAAESRAGGRFDEEMVKQATGGDRMRVRRMREDFWEFSPTHKLFLMTNHRPGVVGEDHAIWRRLRLMPFAVRFWNPDTPAAPGEDRREELRQDKRLGEKLRGEAPGILAWMVRGCLDWQAGGLGTPAVVAEATQGYRADHDSVAMFLAECCVTGTEYRARASDLFQAYRRFLAESGERRGTTQREFGLSLTRRGMERYTNNGTWYRGLALPSGHGAAPPPTEPRNLPLAKSPMNGALFSHER